MQKLARLVLSASVFLSGACATPPDDAHRPALSDWPMPDLDAYVIPAGLAGGFDVREGQSEPSESFHAKDQLLFALELQDGEGRERWLLELVIVNPIAFDLAEDGTYVAPRLNSEVTLTLEDEERGIPISSPLYDARIRLFDGEGTELGSSRIRVPHLIGDGTLETLQLMETYGEFPEGETRDLPEEDLAVMVRTVAAFSSTLSIIDEDGLLRPLLMRAVRIPSVLSMVASFGVSLIINADFGEGVVVSAPPPHLPPQGPFYSLPARILANGELALKLDFLVTDPAPPLAPCGGIVGLVGRHPTDPDLCFTVTVLGAHRAPE